jgi:MarR family transcriptional regulator, transcriptional regulator for hemolysin
VSRRPSPPVRIDRRLPSPLIESPAFVLMQAGRLAMEWTEQALELFEISLTEFAALSILQRLGPMTQAAVAERLGISHVAMSGLASRLEDGGLAKREAHYLDRRRRFLCVTHAGAGLVTRAAGELSAVDSQLREHLPGDAIKGLAELPPEDVGPVVELIRTLGWG